MYNKRGAVMNEVPFSTFSEDVVGWSSHEAAKSDANALSNSEYDYVGSRSPGFAQNYAAYHRASPQMLSHCSQQNQPTSCLQQDEAYHLPASYYDAMDTQADDFESLTRERCHTWPRIQMRPPAQFGAGLQLQANVDSNQHQFSPPPLPSRGSSGLSLISESNESLLTTPVSNAAGADGADWASPEGGLDWSSCDYGNYKSNSNVNQSHARSAVTVSTSTTNTGKRSAAATPSYKSGHPSYVELITQAITSSPEKRMTLSEIYDWMVANVTSFKDQRHLHSSAGWKNSVRHNLSLHARFKRVKRNGMDKPSWWTVDLSEEAKRERSKRPRQPRPRSNTTTATSREFQNHRQNQRPAPVQGHVRPSLGFAQPQVPSHGDHMSSGRGSLSFSGSLTPASSVGSDIFVTGSTTASNAQTNSPQFGFNQSQPAMLEEPVMYQPSTQLLSSVIFDDQADADWGNSGNYLSFPGSSTIRANDRGFDETANVAESTNLHCLSQAITVSLQDPAAAAPTDYSKSDSASNLSATPVESMTGMAINNFGTKNSSPAMSTLVHVFRQNTLDESAVSPSFFSPRQQINSQRSAEVQEINSPPHPYSPSAMYLHQQSQCFQGSSVSNSPRQLSPSYGFQQQQQFVGSPSPLQRQFLCPPNFQMPAGFRKAQTPVLGGSQLPDDLATLDVGGLDCNIMDVLSYEMNCNNGNASGFV